MVQKAIRDIYQDGLYYVKVIKELYISYAINWKDNNTGGLILLFQISKN